jgi:hypothetical protein
MDVNSRSLDAAQFAASGCHDNTCPARGVRDTGEFKSKFLRTANFDMHIDSATEPNLPKSPGRFCAHEDLAHTSAIFAIFVRTPVFSRTIFVRTSRQLRAHTGPPSVNLGSMHSLRSIWIRKRNEKGKGQNKLLFGLAGSAAGTDGEIQIKLLGQPLDPCRAAIR